MHIRKSIFFTRDLARVQLRNYFRSDSLTYIFDIGLRLLKYRLYPHLCIKYVQSLFYHIFLKKYGLFYKKRNHSFHQKRMVCFLFYSLMVKQGMGCLMNILGSFCIVHSVEMHTCNVLRYQVHDLVYGIGKSCCSE